MYNYDLPKALYKVAALSAARFGTIRYMERVIGIDEVGRGCWAGPLLVVAARQVGKLPKGVADSKVLSKKRREALFYDIQLACKLGEGWVTTAEINHIGLAKAMRLGVRRALAALNAQPTDHLIMDGPVNYCAKKFTNVDCVIDADALFPLVSAASIYAKVLRDRHMADIAPKYPLYRFEKHVGYGTKLHQEMLKLHGICALHRVSYKPIQNVLANLEA
jgi:ribonuclease HII